jgi:hypothetical protein
VARHIFQACPVWIYTQSNITQASSKLWQRYIRKIFYFKYIKRFEFKNIVINFQNNITIRHDTNFSFCCVKIPSIVYNVSNINIYLVIMVLPCSSAPCLYAGLCLINGDKYSCRCTSEYIGVRCETKNRRLFKLYFFVGTG